MWALSVSPWTGKEIFSAAQEAIRKDVKRGFHFNFTSGKTFKAMQVLVSSNFIEILEELHYSTQHGCRETTWWSHQQSVWNSSQCCTKRWNHRRKQFSGTVPQEYKAMCVVKLWTNFIRRFMYCTHFKCSWKYEGLTWSFFINFRHGLTYLDSLCLFLIDGTPYWKRIFYFFSASHVSSSLRMSFRCTRWRVFWNTSKELFMFSQVILTLAVLSVELQYSSLFFHNLCSLSKRFHNNNVLLAKRSWACTSRIPIFALLRSYWLPL